MHGKAIATATPIPTRPHQMDQAESSSALMGSERDYANAVILLDELDKASSQDMRFNPVNFLHTLLEPVSAARVRDLSVDVEIDASRSPGSQPATTPGGRRSPCARA